MGVDARQAAHHLMPFEGDSGGVLGQEVFIPVTQEDPEVVGRFGSADQLEARGLLERQVDPDDRRVRLLKLTGEGQKLRREFFTRTIHDAPPLRDLSDADRDTLQSLLAKTVEPQDFLTVPTFRAKARQLQSGACDSLLDARCLASNRLCGLRPCGLFGSTIGLPSVGRLVVQ
jgi:hypothetical protein